MCVGVRACVFVHVCELTMVTSLDDTEIINYVCMCVFIYHSRASDVEK